MSFHRPRYRAFLCALSAASLACNDPSAEREDSVDQARAALTTNERILDFEEIVDWSASAGTVALSTRHTGGATSLGISGIGYAEITSVPLSNLGLVTGTVAFDLLLPLEQPNPYWYGAVSLFVTLPSHGVYNRPVGQQDLQGFTLDAFNHLAFSLPGDLINDLSDSYSDLQFTIVLNVPSGGGTYLLDALSVPATAPPDAGGSGGASAGQEIRIALPNRVDPEDVVLAAADQLRLEDRADMTRFGPTLIVNTGTGESNMGVESKTHDIWSRGPIVLRDRATVAHDATTASTVTALDGATVAGTISENYVAKSDDVISWTVSVPSVSTGDLDLQPGASSPLAPGRYGTVSVKSNAVLSLSPGTYYIGALQVEPEGRVDIDEHSAPVVVYVLESVVYHGNLVGTDGDLDQFMVVHLGSNEVVLETSFDGTFIAPSTRLTLATTATAHQGAFFAQGILVRPDVAVRHRPFSAWQKLVPSDNVVDTIGGPIPLPDTPTGAAIRGQIDLAMGRGPGIQDAYEAGLAGLRGNVAEVVPILVSAYQLMQNRWLDQYALVFLLADLRDPLCGVPLRDIALEPQPARSSQEFDTNSQAQMIQGRAVEGLIRLAQAGSTDAESDLLTCVSQCEGLPRAYAVDAYISLGDHDARVAEVLALLPPSLHYLTSLSHTLPAPSM